MTILTVVLTLMLCLLMTSCADIVDASEDSSAADISSGAHTILHDTSEVNEENDESVVELQPLSEGQLQLRRLNSGRTAISSVDLKNSTESGRILYVEDTDTTFWTDNKYLYQKTGDECFALVSGIVYSLSLYEGKLYFICSETIAAEQPMRGEPFVLDLETGVLTSLSDRTTSAIYVQSDRIILQCFESYTDTDGALRGRYIYYESAHDGAGLTRRDDAVLCTDADRYVTCVQDGEAAYDIYYCRDDESPRILLATESCMPRKAVLYGEYLYFIEGSWGDTIKQVALDGSKAAVCCTDYQYIWDYTFHDGELYLLTDVYFGRVDSEMRFIRGRIMHEDISSTQFYSLYSYKGGIIATTRAGFRAVTADEFGNYLFSHFKFKDDADTGA